MLTVFFNFFFFFQAEDGIRAATVTGVQTCALPIRPGGPSPPCPTPGGTWQGRGTEAPHWGGARAQTRAARRPRDPSRRAGPARRGIAPAVPPRPRRRRAPLRYPPARPSAVRRAIPR